MTFLRVFLGATNPFRQNNAYQQPTNYGKAYTDECIQKQYTVIISKNIYCSNIQA